jgi:uncharacterized protein involved in tolerance to divalent cations
MVNIIIYLDKQYEVQQLVEELLKARLAAKISMDKDNLSYFIEAGELVTKTRTVLTLQTKALHFSAIDTFLQARFGEQVPLCSVPITQVNKRFDQFIRENTTFEND